MRAFVAACFVAGLIAVGAVVVLDYFVQEFRVGCLRRIQYAALDSCGKPGQVAPTGRRML